jgi:hypothetical protein
MNPNIPPFYIGQKVVYITGNNMPKNSIHTVLDVALYFCGKCWGIKISTPSNDDSALESWFNGAKCVRCGTSVDRSTFFKNRKIDYWDAKSFRPVQELKMKKVELHKLMEEIPVSAN